MNKVALTIIAFFALTTILVSTAEACVSCSHTPVVVRGSQTSDRPNSYRRKKRPAYRSNTARGTRAVKKRTVRRKPTTKKRTAKRKTTTKKRVVKREDTAKKVETAKTAPIKSGTENKNSTSSTASLDSSYINCKALSVGCVVAQGEPSKKTRNFGRMTVPMPDRMASGPRDPKTLTRGVSTNNEQ